MRNIDHILLPTDFSTDARNALTFALEIAIQCGASIHLLHSIEEPYDIAPLIEKAKGALKRRVKQLFDDLLNNIKKEKRYQELEIYTDILTGPAMYTIIEETENRNFDLIVMGSKGRTGLEKVFLGSTTSEIIKQSDVPVLAIPKDSEYSPFKKMLFTTNYQDADLEGLQSITAFAAHFDATIDVFHITEDDNLRSTCLFRGFKEIATETISYGKLNFLQHTGSSFFEGMLSHLQKSPVDLVIMIHYQHAFSIFKKKHSQKMSDNITIPLLILAGNNLMNT
ncbi:universal stress protein [Fodinibius saliphilus]|uniref:universal stress protein n=1 Tax=Fodinibius saliphilus TaxID=1920650 RepID=UPI00110895E8|nr:universal stress protein [Fodinibius saliphilus]